MSDARTGWIWDDALAHGKSAANWGEQIESYWTRAGRHHGSRPQWYHDCRILEGKATGPLHYRSGLYQPRPIPSLDRIPSGLPELRPKFPTSIAPTCSARLHAVREERQPARTQHDVDDGRPHSGHNAGRRPASAYVADNDLATGRIIDQISHCQFWKDTAVFVVEDDSQNGIDHVDGHRNIALAPAPTPRRRRRPLVLQPTNLIRTIEQILGLPPMNQQDITAEPMYDVFHRPPTSRRTRCGPTRCR